MTRVVALTGVTGALGGRVARRLVDEGAGAGDGDGVTLRLLARTPGRVPAELATAAEVLPLAYGDTGQAAAALAGVDVLFLVSAAEDEHRRAAHLAMVAAAADAGVRHVVYTSFVGAGAQSVFTLGRDHGATEEALRGAGTAWTFLRDNLYADFLSRMAGDDGVIRGPAGQGRLAAVARADCADSAVAVLRDPAAHEGAAYALTGPEALTLDEVAALVSRAGGRDVRYVEETVPQAWASRAHYGAPDWMVEAWVSTYLSIASGELAAVSDDVERLTGRPATSLATLLAGRAG